MECDVKAVVLPSVCGRAATVVLVQVVAAVTGANGDSNGYSAHRVVYAAVVVDFAGAVVAAAKFAGVVVVAVLAVAAGR